MENGDAHKTDPETPAEASTETPAELTEVNPDPPSSDEGVAMKVTETTAEDDNTSPPEPKIDPHVALMQMPVNNQNDALNCLIGFVGIAQCRGTFALDEAAKAFHCIQMFTPGAQTQESQYDLNSFVSYD